MTLWLLSSGIASAQTIVLGDTAIEILDEFGDKSVELNRTGDLLLGGNGWEGEVMLKHPFGDVTVSLGSTAGLLSLGGGSEDGDLRILDDDGVTTSIDLDGRLGLLTLGAAGEDGDIFVNNDTGARTFQVDGNTGDVTNTLTGNGLVKGWAHVEAGSTPSFTCWRCSQVTKAAAGVYRIRFAGLGDITARPKFAVLSTQSTSFGGNQHLSYIATRNSNTFNDAVVVEFYDEDGLLIDVFRDFTVVVF